MSRCPYCNQKLTGSLAIPSMSVRQRKIYDAVVSAGKDGISQGDLLHVMYDKIIPPGGQVVMRVNVHEINKLIKELGQRIRCQRYGKYRLVAK